MKFNLLNKIMFFHGVTSYSSFPDFTPNVSTLWSLLAQDFLKNKTKEIISSLSHFFKCSSYMLYRSHICETLFIILILMILISILKHHGILYEEFDSFQELLT